MHKGPLEPKKSPGVDALFFSLVFCYYLNARSNQYIGQSMLELLFTNRSFGSKRESFLKKHKIKEQWRSQIKILTQSVILEILPKINDLGIIGIDGKEYSVPTYEQIKNSITSEKLIWLEQKAIQGFTKLMLIPIAMSLDVLINKYKIIVLKHRQENTMSSADGTKLETDPEESLYVWEEYKQVDSEGTLIYYPKQFNQIAHQGLTKGELISQNGPWEVRLIEDLPNLPGRGQGQTLGGRKQLEANQTPVQYLKILQTDPVYQHEQGPTPELWLIKAITYLEQTNQQIDDYQGLDKASYLIGSYFSSYDYVPHGYWSRDLRLANLNGGKPGNHHFHYGAFATGENLLKS